MKRAIDTSIWGDPWFTELSAEAKMVFMYLLTNERSTAAGIFDLSPRRMAFDIGIDQSTAESALAECSARVRWWPDHSIVWVVNFFRHQAVNDNFLKSAQRTYADLPAEIRNEVVMTYPEFDTNPSGTRPVPVSTGKQTHTHIANSNELRVNSDEGLANSPKEKTSPKQDIAEPTAQAHVSKSTKSPDDLFETFWQAYPKSVAGRSVKQQSKAKFKAALKKDSFENIMAGLEWWKKTDKWKSDGGKYVDGAQKWLHNEFWREVMEPEQGRDISPSNQKQPEPATDVDWGPDPNLAWMLDPSLPKPWEKDNG